jgi:hypothetical protein
MGLTSITDMGIGFNTLKSYRDLENAGKIKMRGSLYLSEECLEHREKIIDELPKGELLKIRGIKLFADGSLGSRGAALFEEYSDDPGNTGIILTPLERLEEFVEKANELGLQIAIHAIGDKGLSNALTALSKSKNKGLRHRIEHIQLVNNHLLNKLRELDIVAVIQPLFIKSDSLWAENRLGKERIHFSYPLKSLLDNNIKVAASSDSPVETPNPFLGLFFCVSHKDLEGNGLPEWIKKERIGIGDAIKMYTEGASYALFENKGRIEKGMFADFIVLPENPAKIEVEKIKDLRVLKTFVNGELVYNSENN